MSAKNMYENKTFHAVLGREDDGTLKLAPHNPHIRYAIAETGENGFVELTPDGHVINYFKHDEVFVRELA